MAARHRGTSSAKAPEATEGAEQESREDKGSSPSLRGRAVENLGHRMSTEYRRSFLLAPSVS